MTKEMAKKYIRQQIDLEVVERATAGPGEHAIGKGQRSSRTSHPAPPPDPKRFQLTHNEHMRMRLRGRELDERVQTLTTLIAKHAGDKDHRLSLTRGDASSRTQSWSGRAWDWTDVGGTVGKNDHYESR
jgi:hypothetical protein